MHMKDPLHQLYKTKLALLATLLTVGGLSLRLFSRWAENQPEFAWVDALALGDIGAALFTTGLLAVAWQYFTQETSDTRTLDLFDQAITKKAPAIRDAVIDGFAFSPDDLARVASPATMDKIAENALALQLGDHDLAAAAYGDLRQQVIRSAERRHGTSISVDFAPWQPEEAVAPESMFAATIRMEYRVTAPQPVMRIACVSDPEEYRELFQDPTCNLVYMFKPVGDLDGGNAEAFSLMQLTVDGKERPIRRTKRAKSQIFTVALDSAKSAAAATPAASSPHEVTISYTYRVLVRAEGHMLYLSVGSLTKGLKIAFRYGGCGIRDVNTLDFIASATPARISQTPADVVAPAVEVSFDGWVWPRSGVAFVWMLEAEARP